LWLHLARNPLEWAYKNDKVTTFVFSKRTLRRYEKASLLKHIDTDAKGREKYWLTEKGLKCYLGELPKRQCKVS